MRDEFVGEDGGVGFDFDEVNGHGWDFGEDDATDGVGEGEVDVGELEVDAEVVVLGRVSRWLGLGMGLGRMEAHGVKAYVCDFDLRPDGLVDVHGVVIHPDWIDGCMWMFVIGCRLGRPSTLWTRRKGKHLQIVEVPELMLSPNCWNADKSMLAEALLALSVGIEYVLATMACRRLFGLNLMVGVWLT